MSDEVSVSSELEIRQREEVESVATIYGDIFKDITPTKLIWNKKASPHFQVFLDSWVNEDRPTISLTLDIEFTPTYPLSPALIKILSPKNMLKVRVSQIEQKVKQLIKQFPGEEISFTVISEVKFMLDEFQSTTEKVLSLEEERELRLKNERLAMEKEEELKSHQRELAKKKQDEELNQQIIKIRDEYDDDDDGGSVDDSSYTMTDAELIPKDPSQYIMFENPIVDELPTSRIKVKFKAISGFIKYFKRDLLSGLGRQYIVKPFLPRKLQDKLDQQDIELSYLLTEIDFINSHWNTEAGKREIQDLERELQIVIGLHNVNIVKLLGFQIDKVEGGSGSWKVRLLNEFSSTSESIDEVLRTAEFISWSLSRAWLIQLLPTLEYLHNSGFTHKLICPSTVFIYQSDNLYQGNSTSSESDSQGLDSSTTKILKLGHPSYGFKLLNMLEKHKNVDSSSKVSFYSNYIPENWIAPELKAGHSHTQKTDVWDLGVLFIRIMISYTALKSIFSSPDEFSKKFRLSEYSGEEPYSSLVYDLLSKMLQVKLSKRPTPLELNAVKFLRDGPVFVNQHIGMKHQLAVGETSLHRANNTHLLRVPDTARQDKLGLSRNIKELTSQLSIRKANTAPNYIGENDNLMSGNQRNLGRYERDFEEIGRLGKGGFGEVVKARSRMEGTFYAIKKIKHRSDKLDSLLSEVLSLARLNHQYIVRYYGTWVEEVQESHIHPQVVTDDETETETGTGAENDDDAFDSPIQARSSSFLVSHDNSFQVDFMSNSFDPRIDFDDVSEDDDNDDDLDDIIEFANSTGNSTDQDGITEKAESVAEIQSEVGSNDDRGKSTSPKPTPLQKSILYIQMEFCENNTLSNLIEQGLPGNSSEYWRLFRQLLEAVSYIHGEGFIHRDLKPINIFIDKANNVKVGDFGLAKNSQFTSIISPNNQVSAGNNKELSTVVGTLFYTANEVATGSYDEKVDMYSLGVIFFEMCFSLSTGMERARTLNDLRLKSIDFPSNFTESKYKTEKKVISSLLDHDPKKRPGALQLLQSGWLPVEHQDQVIKEALKSLADPASPWQQQVREALFTQPYSLAKDLMFDINQNKNSHLNHLDPSSSDYLLFSRILSEVFRIFKNHGAIEDFNTNILLPKAPAQSRESVYEVLDRSGSVLTLPYDLTLPTARFLSRSNVTLSKLYRHEFVYRPNLRGSGIPDKYSSVNFDIVGHNISQKPRSDAECLKVVDEIIQSLPCFKIKNSSTAIIINHFSILDSVLSFSFENYGIDENKRHEIFGVLSQLGIDKNAEEVKRYLREDFKVPHTVTKDLIDQFDFTVEVEKASQKFQKLMMDSTYLLRIESALAYIYRVKDILKTFGINTPIYLSPLSNYNSKYYSHGIMFQAVFRVDKSRRFARIATGGRYDSLINSFSNKDVTKAITPHAVGFSLNSTFMFLIMKNLMNKKFKVSECLFDHWKGRRCDVIVTCTNDVQLIESSNLIVQDLWAHNISCDIIVSDPQEDTLSRAREDGADWLVIIKQAKILKKKPTKNRNFKPLKVRTTTSTKEMDLEYDDLHEYLEAEIEERKLLFEATQSESNEQRNNANNNNNEESNDMNKSEDLGPIYSLEIDQRAIVVPNEAPRGRKNNKKEKWELETDSKVASAAFIKSISSSAVITVDVRDEVLDMIAITSISQQEEWIRKVVYSTNNLPKSFAMNIYNTLSKESARGQKWAVLYSPKSEKTALIDLQR